MKSSRTIGIVVICVIGAVIGTFFVTNQFNQLEISNAATTHISEKDILESTINGLQRQIDDLSDNWQDYDKLMINGLKEFSIAMNNGGYAKSDYDSANGNYDEGYFDIAETYANSADVNYAYSSFAYRNAKAYFKEAKNIAPNEKTYQLAELYFDLSEFGAQITDEMHQANEYFSSACNCYYKNWWEIGDTEIERMNEHIVIHDEIIPDFNDCLSDIEVLLDTF